MKLKSLLIALLFSFYLPQALALTNSSTNLGSCLVDSMTGKERKDMAQWVFFAMAAHPLMQDYAKIPAQTRIDTDKHIAALVTRLLTEDCLTQAQNAFKQQGQAAIVSAFELVGKVAMQELMQNPNVGTAISTYAKYLDAAKMQKISVP